MKTSSNTRSSRPSAPPMSPTGRIRKASEERREKQKVETALRQLLGHSSEATQLELALSAISYIRELQNQLAEDEENQLPAGFEQYFEKAVRT